MVSWCLDFVEFRRDRDDLMTNILKYQIALRKYFKYDNELQTSFSHDSILLPLSLKLSYMTLV